MAVPIFFPIFAAMNNAKWNENVILVDADYADKVAFDLIVNFERMIGRRIPQADMARWLECVALDGGLREGEHQTQVVLIHSKDKQQMENFLPGTFSELDGKAFTGELGEFQRFGANLGAQQGQAGGVAFLCAGGTYKQKGKLTPSTGFVFA